MYTPYTKWCYLTVISYLPYIRYRLLLYSLIGNILQNLEQLFYQKITNDTKSVCMLQTHLSFVSNKHMANIRHLMWPFYILNMSIYLQIQAKNLQAARAIFINYTQTMCRYNTDHTTNTGYNSCIVPLLALLQ